MKILDLFCKAGGASAGYAHSWVTEIRGVDITHQKRYPFEFIQANALEVPELIEWADFIHASPPCQHFSVQTKQHGTMDEHPDLVAPIREILKASGKPYVIENVPGAPLENPILLCGSMFGSKQLRRHRLFECSFPVYQPKCNHGIQGRCISVTGHAGGKSTRDGDRLGSTTVWKRIMDIDWMTGNELAEAIPPFYTKYLIDEFFEYGSHFMVDMPYGKVLQRHP